METEGILIPGPNPIIGGSFRWRFKEVGFNQERKKAVDKRKTTKKEKGKADGNGGCFPCLILEGFAEQIRFL